MTENNDKIIMPEVRGVDFLQALNFLESRNIEIHTMLYEESEFPRNMVIYQSIKPGTELTSSTKLKIKVSGLNPIRFLPSIFHSEENQSNHFLRRFLWIFQHIINETTLKLDYLQNYFNPITTPDEFFPWLASWFAMDYDYGLSNDTMRLLVKEAVQLFQWRGTKIGIQKFLEIITGITPNITEHNIPLQEYIIEKDTLVERPILAENTSLYNFVVSFPVPVDYFTFETVKLIYHILKVEKPAHTNFYVMFENEQGHVETQHGKIGIDAIV